MTIFSPAIERVCQLTGRKFEVSERERVFWESLHLPLPSISPDERLRRLLAFAGGTTLSEHSSDTPGNTFISAFSSSAPFPVSAGQSEAANQSKLADMGGDNQPLSFGRDYQFKRLFMEQLLELWREVPRPALWNDSSASSPLVNEASELSFCSAVFQSSRSTDCRYSVFLEGCNGCLDSFGLLNSQECYESVWCSNSGRLRYCYCCTGCQDSWLLSNCVDCINCFGCVNLVNQRYCIFNQRFSKAEYFERLAHFGLDARPLLDMARNQFAENLEGEPIPHIFADSAALNSGNYLVNTQLCLDSFCCTDSVELINCFGVRHSREILDSVFISNVRKAFQCVSCADGADLSNSIFCRNNVQRLTYCSHCEDSSDLFGCIGLRGQRFCILNKQYTESDYHTLREKIEQHLRGRAVYGSFYPPGFSGYSYNHSFAGALLPLTRIPAKMMGFPWDDATDEHLRPSQLVPSDSTADQIYLDMPNDYKSLQGQDLNSRFFLCAVSGIPFQISEWELSLAASLGVPPPDCCFQQRHMLRLSGLTPLQISYRDAQPGAKSVRTSVPTRWRRELAVSGSISINS